MNDCPNFHNMECPKCKLGILYIMSENYIEDSDALYVCELCESIYAQYGDSLECIDYQV